MGRVVSEQPDEPYNFLIHVLERKANRQVCACVRTGVRAGVCVCVCVNRYAVTVSIDHRSQLNDTHIGQSQVKAVVI